MSRIGQYGVVRTTGLIGAIIRLGTRSQVNHAFVFIGNDRVVEAQPGGAVIGSATKYAHLLHPVSRFPLTDAEARRIAAAAEALVGTPYNFLDIAALGLLSLGLRWGWLERRAQSSKRLICSQLVDRAYSVAGVPLFTDGRPDGSVTPGDLLLLLARRSTGTVL